MALTSEAVQFAAERHSKQKRKFTGEPYFNHLARVATRVERWLEKFDSKEPTIVQTTYLHDAYEEGLASLEEIEKRFGKAVRYLVEHLSHKKGESILDPISRASKWAQPWLILIKIADRVDNLSDHPNPSSHYMSESRRLLSYAIGLDKDFILGDAIDELKKEIEKHGRS